MLASHRTGRCRVPDRLGLVRRRHQQALRPARPAQLRLRQSGRDQRAAHRQQGGGAGHADRRRRQGLVRGLARAAARPRLGAADVDGAGRRARRVPRPPLSGVPPLRGRQGRGDRAPASCSRSTGRWASGSPCCGWSWRFGFKISSLAALDRRRADADRRVLRVRQRADRLGAGADRAAAVLAAPRQHPPAARGQGNARSGADVAAGVSARPPRAPATPGPSAAAPRTRRRPARRCEPQRADERDHRAVVGAERRDRERRPRRRACAPPRRAARAARGWRRRRRRRPAARWPVASSAASALPTSTSTTACLELARDVGLARVVERSGRGLAPDERQHRGLQAAEKLMSRSPLSSIGRGSADRAGAPAFGQPRERRPAGIGRPSSFAVLSKASPAASSSVSPSSR